MPTGSPGSLKPKSSRCRAQARTVWPAPALRVSIRHPAAHGTPRASPWRCSKSSHTSTAPPTAPATASRSDRPSRSVGRRSRARSPDRLSARPPDPARPPQLARVGRPTGLSAPRVPRLRPHQPPAPHVGHGTRGAGRMQLSRDEVEAAAYAVAGYVRRQQLDRRPVPQPVAELLDRLQAEAVNPTPPSRNRRPRHESGASALTCRTLDVGQSAPKIILKPLSRHKTGATDCVSDAACSTLDAGRLVPETGSATPELIGCDRAAAILDYSKRSLQRRYREYGGVLIDRKIWFNTNTIHAIAAAQQQRTEGTP